MVKKKKKKTLFFIFVTIAVIITVVVSLTIIADKIKERPSCKIYCIKIIKGKAIIETWIPTPLINKATKTITLEIKKLIKLLVAVEIGKISLGK